MARTQLGVQRGAETAEALFRAGRFPEAKVRCLERGTGDPRTLERLGAISLLENRAEDAVRYLDRALAQASWTNRHWPLSGRIRAQIGMAHYRGDRFPEASKEFVAAAGPIPVGPFGELAALGRHLAAFGDDPPYRIHGPESTRLELEVVDPLPVVSLSVNEGRPTLFFLDTGGAEIVLDRGFAEEAGADMVGHIAGEYAGRKRARTGLGRVNSIGAGEMRIDDVPVHTLDLAALPAFFGMDIRGILGTRFLMHFLSTIDYPGGALILRRRGPEATREAERERVGGQARSIPFWLAGTHLILARGTLNPLPSTLFWVDTGLAGSGFLAPERTFRAAGVTVDWSVAHDGPGGGGLARGTDVVVSSLTLGEGDAALTHSDVPGTVLKKAPTALGHRLGFEIGGLISHAFFRSHALTLDFANMRLRLEDAPRR